MVKRTDWQQTLSGLAAVALIVGCSQSSQPDTDKGPMGIHFPGTFSQLTRQTQSIESLSTEQVSKTVQVEGTVLQQAPLLERTLYQIEDATGQLWVLTSESSPQLGETVQVIGRLQYEPVLINEADIGDYYLEETNRSVLQTSSGQ